METDRRDGIEPPAIVFVTTYSTAADKGPILQVNNNTDFRFLISFKKDHDSAIFLKIMSQSVLVTNKRK